MATAAPVVAILARTSGWSFVARWDLERDRVEWGAWLRGTIYARRCDVSPDGTLLYYFALKGGKPFHAVSRLPWLTALALWRDDSTYTNGGYFVDAPAPGPAPEGFLQRAPDLGDAAPLLHHHRLRLVAHRTDAYKVERVRGFTEHARCPPRRRADTWDERRAQLLERACPVDGAVRLVLVDVGITRGLGHIDGRKPSYHLERGEQITALPGVTWADWDARGQLLVATERGTLERRDRASLAIVSAHDLGSLVPDPQPSPRGAARW